MTWLSGVTPSFPVRPYISFTPHHKTTSHLAQLSSSLELMTHVGRWGQWFVSTVVCRSPVVQPPVVNIHTSPWCRRTIFLAVFHEADLLPPFPTSLSSPVADLTFCRLCPNSFNFCFIRSIIVKCLPTYSLTLLLVTLSFQYTLVFSCSTASQMSGVFSSLQLFL